MTHLGPALSVAQRAALTERATEARKRNQGRVTPEGVLRVLRQSHPAQIHEADLAVAFRTGRRRLRTVLEELEQQGSVVRSHGGCRAKPPNPALEPASWDAGRIASLQADLHRSGHLPNADLGIWDQRCVDAFRARSHE